MLVRNNLFVFSYKRSFIFHRIVLWIENNHSVRRSVLVILAIFYRVCNQDADISISHWQPDTYEQSPTAVTMVLSGIMVKMGLFGLIRWLGACVANRHLGMG